MLQLDDPIFDPAIARYHAELEALSNRALSGSITEREYRDGVERLTLAMITAVFLLGGGDPESPEGERFLTEQRQIARDSARALAGDLFDGRYSAGEGKTADEGKDSLLTRLALWTFTLGTVYQHAFITSPTPTAETEPSFTWEWGNTIEHCPTCTELRGQTKTKSEWAELAYLGIEPQGTGLACGGWKCLCRYIEVSA